MMRKWMTVLCCVGLFASAAQSLGLALRDFYDISVIFFLVPAGIAHLLLWPAAIRSHLLRTLRGEVLNPVENQALQLQLKAAKNACFQWVLLLVLLSGFAALAEAGSMVSLGTFLAVSLIAPLLVTLFYWWLILPVLSHLKKQALVFEQEIS